MKILHVAIFAILLFGTAPAWGVEDLVAYLPISGEPVTPQFKFSKEITLDYPNGGKLKDALEGRNLSISFEENSYSNQSVKGLMEEINSGLQGPTRITYLVLNYSFVLAGRKSSASLDYTITLTPMISGYVISNGTQANPTVLDASWIDFDIKDPVVIDSQKYDDMEINHPSDILKGSLPDAYAIIAGTGAEGVFDKNMVSSGLFSSMPLDRWDKLFDPAYTLGDSAGLDSKGLKVPVTTFSAGVGTLPSGVLALYEVDEDFTGSDGMKYHVSLLGGADAATVNVQGHASPYLSNGNWAFATVPSAYGPSCCVQPWDETPVVWVGIISAAVAGFFVLYFRRFKE